MNEVVKRLTGKVLTATDPYSNPIYSVCFLPDAVLVLDYGTKHPEGTFYTRDAVREDKVECRVEGCTMRMIISGASVMMSLTYDASDSTVNTVQRNSFIAIPKEPEPSPFALYCSIL